MLPIGALGSSFLRSLLTYFCLYPTKWVMSLISNSGRGREGESSFLNCFPHLSILHNAPISHLFLEVGGNITWNLHFFQNLNDRESQDLLSLLTILNTSKFSTRPYGKLWTLKGLGSCKSFIAYASNSPSYFPFPHIFGMQKCPLKLRLSVGL